MGVDARIQFDAPKLTTKEVMVDMAYAIDALKEES